LIEYFVILWGIKIMPEILHNSFITQEEAERRRTLKALGARKTVMERGAVMIEPPGERNSTRDGMAILRNFMVNSEWFLDSSEPGKRRIVAVPAPIMSRHPQTDGYGPWEGADIARIREVAMLAANWEAAQRGVISEVEFARQLDPSINDYSSKAELTRALESAEGLLGRELGRVKYRPIGRKEDIRERHLAIERNEAAEAAVAMSTRSMLEARYGVGHVQVMTQAQVSEIQNQRMSRRDSRRNRTVSVLALGGMAVMLAACATPVRVETPKATQAVRPTDVSPTVAPSPTAVTKIESSPTPARDATAEALKQVNSLTLPNPVSFPSAEIEAAFKNGEYATEVGNLLPWYKLWVSAGVFFDQPLTEVLKDPNKLNSIHLEIIPSVNGGKGMLVLSTTDKNFPDFYMQPFDQKNSKFMTPDQVPSYIPGQPLDQKYKLFTLSKAGLSSLNGTPVKVDAKGVIVMILDRTGNWINADKLVTPGLKPTEVAGPGGMTLGMPERVDQIPEIMDWTTPDNYGLTGIIKFYNFKTQQMLPFLEGKHVSPDSITPVQFSRDNAAPRDANDPYPSTPFVYSGLKPEQISVAKIKGLDGVTALTLPTKLTKDGDMRWLTYFISDSEFNSYFTDGKGKLDPEKVKGRFALYVYMDVSDRGLRNPGALNGKQWVQDIISGSVGPTLSWKEVDGTPHNLNDNSNANFSKLMSLIQLSGTYSDNNMGNALMERLGMMAEPVRNVEKR
jgi:hypothetical protein